MNRRETPPRQLPRGVGYLRGWPKDAVSWKTSLAILRPRLYFLTHRSVIVLLRASLESAPTSPGSTPHAHSERMPGMARIYFICGQPLSVKHTLLQLFISGSNRRIAYLHNARTYHYYAIMANTYPGSRGSGAPHIGRLGDDWMGSRICDPSVAQLPTIHRRNAEGATNAATGSRRDNGKA